MENFQISAKNLGAMEMPDFCPRCFWIKLHCKKLPWQMFPGIFSTIDSYTKKIVHEWIDENNMPGFLQEYGVTGYQPAPYWKKFRFQTESGITLSGMADDIWTVPGGIVIPDYKTAKFTENADKLLPIYRTQLNGYAAIAEAIGMGPVVGIVLVYMEPQTEVNYVKLNAISSMRFGMTFVPHVLPLELDSDSINPLLERAKSIYNHGMPYGVDGCKDCAALDDVRGRFLS